jgi:hypothetical protein
LYRQPGSESETDRQEVPLEDASGLAVIGISSRSVETGVRKWSVGKNWPVQLAFQIKSVGG